MRKIISHMTLLMMLIASVAYGDTHTSQGAGGNFNDITTWDVGAIPAIGDEVIILAGDIVTVTVNDRISILTIEAGGELSVNNSRQLRVDGVLTLENGAGLTGAIISGLGRLRHRNGTVTVSQIGGAGAVAVGATISVANFRMDANQVFTVADDGNPTTPDLIMSGVVTEMNGSRIFTKTGAGMLTLSGANTFTNNFRLYGGALNLNNAQAIGLGGITKFFDINGGTTIDNTSGGLITLTSLNTTRVYNSFTFTGDNHLDMGVGAYQWRGDYTITTAAAGVNLTFSGIVADVSNNDEIIKEGPGTLTLSAANTFEQILLNAGQLNINHPQALGNETGNPGAFEIAAGTIIDNTSGASVVSIIAKRTFVNGDFTFIGSSDLSLGTGQVRWNGNHTVTVNAGDLTLDGAVTDVDNDDDLIKDGAGALTLSKNNIHQSTTLNAGILNINHIRALGQYTTAAGTFIVNGGTIDNTSGAAITLTRAYRQQWNSSFTFRGTNDLDMSTGVISLTGDYTITTTAGEFTINGVISDVGDDDELTKAGAGTLTLKKSNTHDRTILNAGVLNINHVRALGGENGTNGTPAFVINGGSIDNTSGAKITLNRAYKQQWNADFTFVGTNDLDLNTGRVELTGDYTVTTIAGELTINSVIVDAGDDDDLIKDGAGTLTLKKSNTHQSTTLNAGTLNINHVRALGGEALADGSFKVNGGTIDNTSGAAITLTRAYRQTWNANFIFTGTDNLNMSTGAVTMTADVTINASTDAKILTQGGIIGGGFRLTKTGAGTLALDNANIHSGTTLTAGVLNLGDNQALGAAGNTFVINGGTLDNTIGGAATAAFAYPQTWNADWTFTGTNDFNMGGGAIDFTTNISLTTTANSLTVGGVINDVTQNLTKLGGGVLAFESQAVSLYGVTITSGTLIPPTGAGVLSLSGNLENNSTLTTTTGKVDFAGAAAQVISGSSTSTIYDFELSGGGGITLNAPLIISNSLTLSNGKIIATSLLTVNDGATSTNGNGNSYIIGTMRKYGATAFVFPVGAAAVWAPIEISNFAFGDATTAFEAGYAFLAHGSANQRDTSVVKLRKVSKVEFWNLDHVGGTAPTVDITLHWKDRARSGTTITGVGTDSLIVAHFNGSKWESYGQSALTYAAVGSVTCSGVSSFSPFSFGSLAGDNKSSIQIPLPVELIEFKVDKGYNGSVLVTWTTASEIDNDYFVVQRSVDGFTFEDVHVVPGRGGVDGVTTYVFQDYEKHLGSVYYRLKQVDLDETEDLSEVIQSKGLTKESLLFTMYPNPALSQGNVTIRNPYIAQDEKVLIQIFNYEGKFIFAKTSFDNFIDVPIGSCDFRAGLYFVRVSVGSHMETMKLIVQ